MIFFVESNADSRAGSAGPSGPLVGASLGNWVELKTIYSNVMIIELNLLISRVNNVPDSLQSHRGLSYISGNNAFSFIEFLKDEILTLLLEQRVKGENNHHWEVGLLNGLANDLAAKLNFLLSWEKNQDISRALFGMNLDCFFGCCLNIVIHIGGVVLNINRKESPRNRENRRLIKKGIKFLHIHSCRGYDKLEICSLETYALDKPE